MAFYSEVLFVQQNELIAEKFYYTIYCRVRGADEHNKKILSEKLILFIKLPFFMQILKILKY